MKNFTYRSSDGKYGFTYSEKNVQEILRHCAVAGQNETGGLLVGFYSENLDIANVRAVGGPPPDSKAGRTWFQRGVSGLKSWLHKLWFGDHVYFIGEWHFHPFASPAPSSIDFSQMNEIATNPKWQCTAPILMIVGGDPNGEWEVSVHVCPRDTKPLAMNKV